MSVRQSLLAILDQGPCYGYQLRSEFDRRTGSTWPLNVGQIYNTLERLERDGLVQRGDADENGHIYWHITPEGSAEVSEWLASPVVRAEGRAGNQTGSCRDTARGRRIGGRADSAHGIPQSIAATSARQVLGRRPGRT
jgi:DNA-binding PadR family transcriptional regulator